MPLNPDLTVFERLKTKQDFDRERQQFELQRQLAQAQVKKAQQLDIDAMGEQAFYKAAQGLELTPQERAAAAVVDAKSGGVVYNPVTGQATQKPRLSDKINLGGINAGQSDNLDTLFPPQGGGRNAPPPAPTGMGNPAINQGYGDIVPSIDESMMNDQKIGDNESAARQLTQSEPYYQTPKGQAEAAKMLMNARMQDIKSQKEKNNPMPASVLTLQNKIVGEASGAGNVINSTQKYIDMIDTGKLDLGMFSNIVNYGRNYTGKSNEVSRNFSSFKSDLEKMRNDSLRLNAGVQTDGDAQRAWNELIANINDPLVVRQRLEEINGYNQTALAIKQGQLEDIRKQYGKDPLDINIVGNNAPKPKSLDKASKAETIFNAKKAVQKGGNVDAIRQRLIDNGIDPSEAGL